MYCDTKSRPPIAPLFAVQHVAKPSKFVIFCYTRISILTTIWSISLMKTSKIGATVCQILRLKCTKFDLCCGSAPDLAGNATKLLQRHRRDSQCNCVMAYTVTLSIPIPRRPQRRSSGGITRKCFFFPN